jgi:hypothetical protein
VQHRQVKATAIPGHELRCESLDAIEESLDELSLHGPGIPQTPQFQTVTRAQDAGDGHDTLLLVGNEITARALATQSKHRLGNLLIAETFEPVQPAAELNIRNRLDIENQCIHDSARGGSNPTE